MSLAGHAPRQTIGQRLSGCIGDVMTTRILSRGDCAVKGWMNRLLLAAVVLRALIPVGFMPDFGAAANGEFKVVICTASGSKQVTLDADGQLIAGDPSSDQKAPHHDEPCAFAGIAGVAIALIDTPYLSAPQFDVAATFVSDDVTLPPARAGPVLGSRGPPQFS